MGGGWYAMERTKSKIDIWFWERNDDTVPVDVANPGPTVNTNNWGIPDASFPDTSCDFDTHFGKLNIIFDTTLCWFILLFFDSIAMLTKDWLGGDLAGAPDVYARSGCPSTCVGMWSSLTVIPLFSRFLQNL